MKIQIFILCTALAPAAHAAGKMPQAPEIGLFFDAAYWPVSDKGAPANHQAAGSGWRDRDEVWFTGNGYEPAKKDQFSFSSPATAELHKLLSDALASRGVQVKPHSTPAERFYPIAQDMPAYSRRGQEPSPLVERIKELRSQEIDVNQEINGVSIQTLMAYVTAPEIKEALNPLKPQAQSGDDRR